MSIPSARWPRAFSARHPQGPASDVEDRSLTTPQDAYVRAPRGRTTGPSSDDRRAAVHPAQEYRALTAPQGPPVRVLVPVGEEARLLSAPARPYSSGRRLFSCWNAAAQRPFGATAARGRRVISCVDVTQRRRLPARSGCASMSLGRCRAPVVSVDICVSIPISRRRGPRGCRPGRPGRDTTRHLSRMMAFRVVAPLPTGHRLSASCPRGLSVKQPTRKVSPRNGARPRVLHGRRWPKETRPSGGRVPVGLVASLHAGRRSRSESGPTSTSTGVAPCHIGCSLWVVRNG